jgi:hypothetical protein
LTPLPLFLTGVTGQMYLFSGLIKKKESAMIESEDCKRTKVFYRGENLYVTVSPRRVDLSIQNTDQFKTLAGLALVERLMNELLDRNVPLEELSSICFENSYRGDDLPALLSKILDRCLK